MSVIHHGDRGTRSAWVGDAQQVELGLLSTPALAPIVGDLGVEVPVLHPCDVDVSARIGGNQRPVAVASDLPIDRVDSRVGGLPAVAPVRGAVAVDVCIPVARILPVDEYIGAVARHARFRGPRHRVGSPIDSHRLEPALTPIARTAEEQPPVSRPGQEQGAVGAGTTPREENGRLKGLNDLHWSIERFAILIGPAEQPPFSGARPVLGPAVVDEAIATTDPVPGVAGQVSRARPALIRRRVVADGYLGRCRRCGPDGKRSQQIRNPPEASSSLLSPEAQDKRARSPIVEPETTLNVLHAHISSFLEVLPQSGRSAAGPMDATSSAISSRVRALWLNPSALQKGSPSPAGSSGGTDSGTLGNCAASA